MGTMLPWSFDREPSGRVGLLSLSEVRFLFLSLEAIDIERKKQKS